MLPVGDRGSSILHLETTGNCEAILGRADLKAESKSTPPPQSLVRDFELPFALRAKGRGESDYRSNNAIDSTCAVCGNMSIAPADTSLKPHSLTR